MIQFLVLEIKIGKTRKKEIIILQFYKLYIYSYFIYIPTLYIPKLQLFYKILIDIKYIYIY